MTGFQQAKFEIGLFLTISKNLWTSRGLAFKGFHPWQLALVVFGKPQDTSKVTEFYWFVSKSVEHL